jgi:hypothetical protein
MDNLGNIMSKLVKLLGIILASWLGLSSAYAQDLPTSTFQSVTQAPVVIHPAPEGARLHCVPAMAPRQPVWATIVDAQGQPLSGVSLLVNNASYDSNSFGQVTFAVPNTGAVSLVLKNAAGEEILHKDYALLPDGLLAVPEAAELVRRLVPVGVTTAGNPSLDFAPVLVEPGQSVVVLGRGFAADPRFDRLVIDGMSCDSWSASTVSILAHVPDNLSLGPLKQLFVGTRGSVTASAETDVARPALQLPETSPSKGKLSGRISVEGTLLPALVEFHNQAAKSVTVTTTDGQVLEDGCDLVLPGGVVNYLAIDVTGRLKHLMPLSLRLVPDAPQLSETSPAGGLHINTLLGLDYAVLVRLKRREISVETKLGEAAAAPLPGDGIEQDKTKTQTQALALRRRALAAAISARHAILLADGGNEQQYCQAIDDAAGGAYYVLESKVRNAALVPDKVVLQPVAAVPLVTTVTIVIPDVHFKLWPPAESVAAAAPMPPQLKSGPVEPVSSPHAASQVSTKAASQGQQSVDSAHKTAPTDKKSDASKGNAAKSRKAATSAGHSTKRRHRRHHSTH